MKNHEIFKIIYMSTENLKADVIPMPEGSSQLGGNAILINGRLTILGGYRDNDIWTPNYSNDFDINSPNLTYSYRIDMTRNKVKSSTVDIDYTRYIGGTVEMLGDSLSTLSFGGSCQRNEPDKKCLKLSVSNDLILHKWDHECNLVSVEKINPQIIGTEEESVKKGTAFIPIEDQCPQPRAFHGCAWDSGREYLWVIGGGNFADSALSFRDDIWYWEKKTKRWNRVAAENGPEMYLGQSLVYHNNILYMLSGRDVSCFIYFLDVTNVDSLKWERIRIPDDYIVPINGAKMILCQSLLLDDYLLIIGGTKEELYSPIMSSQRLRNTNCLNPPSLKMIGYNLSRNKFHKYRFTSNIPHVSFASIAKDRDSLYIIGGISTKNSETSFNRNIFKIRFSDIFSKETAQMFNIQRPTPKNFKLENMTLKRIEMSLNEAVKSEEFAARKSIYEAVKEKMRNIKDYIIIGDNYAEVEVIKLRFHGWSDEFAQLPAYYVNDVFTYAYTDWIEPYNRPLDFPSLLKLFTLLRKLGAYRLMWMLLALQINQLSFMQIIQINTLTSSTALALCDEPNFAIGRLFIQQTLALCPDKFFEGPVIRLMMQVNDFKPLLKELRASGSITFDYYNILELPRSSFKADMAFYNSTNFIKCKDGYIACDTEEIGDVDFSLYRFAIIHSVITHKTGSFIKNIKDIKEMFKLLNNSPHLSLQLAEDVFNDNIDQLAHTLIKNKNETVNFINKFNKPLVIFIINVLGTVPRTKIESTYGGSIGISSISDNTFQEAAICCEIQPENLIWVAFLFYTNFNFKRLEEFINPRDISISLLRVLSSSQIFLNQTDYDVCKKYVSKMLILDPDGSFNENVFAEYFCELFNIGLHEELIERAPDDKWQEIIAAKYVDKLSCQQLKWLTQKASESDKPIEHTEAAEESESETDGVDYFWVNS